MAESDVHVCEIAVPREDEIPWSWVARQTDELSRAQIIESTGNDDRYAPLSMWVPVFRDTSETITVHLVAVDGVDRAALATGPHGLPMLSWHAGEVPPEGRVLGYAIARWFVRENLTEARVTVEVSAAHRRKGVGTALRVAAEALAELNERVVVTASAHHRPVRAGEDIFAPPGGGVCVPREDPSAAFARAAGYELQQCQILSVQELAGVERGLDELWAGAIDHADGYAVYAFTGPVPEELVAGVAALYTHFSTEVPTGGRAVEAEFWDVERLREAEAGDAAIGMTSFSAVAVEETTGAVVAQTRVVVPLARPVAAFQVTTVVHADHRGHRLGLLVKIANARGLIASGVPVQRVHTSNADENAHMRAINHALGYEPRLVTGTWQRRLAD